jgi:type III secretory pathway component EscS
VCLYVNSTDIYVMETDTIINLLFYIPIITVTLIVGLVVLVNSNATNILWNTFAYGMFVLATTCILIGYYTQWDFL